MGLTNIMVNKSRIKNNLEEYSFPRLSGTGGESKAFNLTKKRIESLDLHPHIQKFTFSKFYPRYYPRIISITTFLLLLIFYLNLPPLVFILSLIITFSIIIPTILITRKPKKIPFGKKYKSQNIYVKFNNSNEDRNTTKRNQSSQKGYNFLFFSHIDSKGQIFSIRFRIISYLLWISSSIITTFFILLKVLIFQGSLVFHIIILLSLLLTLIGIAMININFTNNNSNGAIDNATGIAINLELLHYFSKRENRPRNINIYIVFTGCEEQGTAGIQYFYEIIKDLDREKTRIINFDSVAQNIDIWDLTKISLNHHAFSELLNNEEKFEVTIHTQDSKIYFTRSDFLYLFREGGFTGFTCGDKSMYEYIHSKRDTIDKVDVEVLSNLTETIIKFVREFDEKI